MTNWTAMTYAVFVDFDYSGSGTPDFTTSGDDITTYAKSIPSITLGINSPMNLIAYVGACEITLNNVSKRFSPAYTSGPMYGKLLPNKPVKVTMTDGLTTWTIFYGYTALWTPTTGDLGARECTLSCVDELGKIQNEGIGIPLQESATAGVLVKHVVNTALGAPTATGTLTIAAGNAANNDTHQAGNVTYTYKTTLSGGADEVFVGASNTATASNLAAAINKGDGAGTTYATNTTRNTQFSASASAGVVTVTALIRGAIGNGYVLAKSGANLSVSGATASGGSDYPTSPAPSYQTGVRTFDIAADQWTPESTNGMTAIEQVVESERGLFWIARDGTVTFKTTNYPLTQASASANLTLSSEHNALDAALADEDVFNRVEVSAADRAQLSSGVVANAKSVIQVPGQSGTERWNGTVVLPGGGSTVVKLPFTDPTTGQTMGAKSITTPLAPTTDWTANEASDGGSVDYTGNANLTFSLAINGANCEISIKNTALGPLYITLLKVRGVGIVTYNPSVYAVEDSTSQTTYGKKTLSVSLPIASGQLFGQALAAYYLSRYKTPAYRISAITFNEQNKIGSVNLFSLEIGNVIAVTDTQTGVTSSKYLIVGVQYANIAPRRSGSITFNVYRLDDATYGVWDTSKWDGADKWSI